MASKMAGENGTGARELGGVQKHPNSASDGRRATSAAVTSSACRPLGRP